MWGITIGYIPQKGELFMGRPRMCVYCGEKILPEEKSVPFKKRYAHERCFNEAIKSAQQEKQKKLDEKIKTKTGRSKKPQIELKDAMSEEEYKEKKKFYDYVRSLYKEDEELPAKIYAVVEDYRRKYNFTFDGMYKTLFYLHELKGRDLEKDIVGIIKYYYSEALKYYRQIEQVEELNKDIDVSNFYKTRTVCVTPRQNKKQKQIDISLIGEDSNA